MSRSGTAAAGAAPGWTAAPPPCRRRCTAAVLVLLLLVVVPPRGALSIRTDKALSTKDEHVSATVNATVLDAKGNPVQMMSNDDGTYGQNSPKSDTRGTVIAPAHYHGGTFRWSQGCAHGAGCARCRFPPDSPAPSL